MPFTSRDEANKCVECEEKEEEEEEGEEQEDLPGSTLMAPKRSKTASMATSSHVGGRLRTKTAVISAGCQGLTLVHF
jgi:hypothetical protein